MFVLCRHYAARAGRHNRLLFLPELALAGFFARAAVPAADRVHVPHYSSGLTAEVLFPPLPAVTEIDGIHEPVCIPTEYSVYHAYHSELLERVE